MEIFLLPLLIFGVLALGAGLLAFVFKLILIPIKLAFGLVGMILGLVFFAVLLPILIPVVLGVAGIGLAIACVILAVVLLPLGLLFWWV
jgi:hypothetical protein